MSSPSDADLELAFLDQFLLSKGIEPYPVQEQAIGAIYQGKSVLVTVPTGTGKTLMAKAAPGAVFMHCLPAHRGEEVTHDVLESPRSLIWQQVRHRTTAMYGVLRWLEEK